MVTFHRFEKTSLYLPDGFKDPKDARIGLVLDSPGADTAEWPGAFGASIVVFWSAEVDWPAFLARLNGQLSGLPAGTPRFAWFDVRGNRLRSLSIPGSGILPATQNLPLSGARITVNLGAQSVVEALAGGVQFRAGAIAHTAVFSEETPTGAPGPQFTLAITGAVTISFTGKERGCLKFDLPLSERRLAAFGTQIRYFKAQPVDSDNNDLAAVDMMRFPVFRLDSSQLVAFQIQLDPVALFDPARTFFGFRVDEEVLSYFETTLGHPVRLRASGDSRLIFDRSIREIDADGLSTFEFTYLTPSGSFELVVPGDDGGPGWPEMHGLTLGRSNSEHVLFRPRRNRVPGHRIVFHPRMPATDRASLPPGAASLTTRVLSRAGELLSDLVTTSWMSFAPAPGTASLTASSPPLLVSQPAELELFADRPAGSAGLGAAGPRSMPFDPRPRADAAAIPMPMVPFLGVNTLDPAAAASHAALEGDLIALARREATRPPGGAALTAGLVPAEQRVTPHGFPATLEGAAWRRLVLAGSPTSGPLELTDLGDPFTRVLTGNRTFLVATQLGEGLAKLGERIDIAGWGFAPSIFEAGAARLEPPAGTALPPTLVFKYHDRSIFDLLGMDAAGQIVSQEAAGWTEPEAFNQNWREVRGQLRRYLADTLARHQKLGAASPYFLLLERLKDPHWNGVLFFFAGVLPGILPQQVKGLLAGIDLEHFHAHHVGIDLNRIGQQGFELERSALFGVVEYPLPAFEQEKEFDPGKDEGVGDGGEGKIANFRVDHLRIQFENSEVRRFDCKVSLWLENLLREPTSRKAQPQPADKIISFDGKYERRREPDGREVETYTFAHEGKHEFDLDSFLIDKLTITRLQMTTTAADDERIVSRFAFWGELKFQKIEALDLFSLDQIQFGDLGIELDFGVKLKLKHFRLSLGSIKFELPELGRRLSGLLGKLPFRFKFFQFGDGLRLPDLGYFKFGNGFGGDLFDFGLGFDLDLGSLGSLAKKLGGLRLEALLGWLPKIKVGELPKFAFGFKLAGTGGGALDIGIEGVLKLVIEHLELEEFEYQGQKMLAIQAVDSRLEVLGKKFPGNDSELKVFLFVDPKTVGTGKLSEVGWLGILTGSEGGDGFQLPLLALGQRVDAYPKSGVPTTRQVIDHIKTIGALDRAGKLPSLFDPKNKKLEFAPSREWTIALQTVLWELADLDLVFLDPDLYGIRLRVPGNGGNPQIFAVDVLYRKISDDLGVYSIELAMPDAWRHIDFGYFTLTLPVIGLDLYTNGDFQIDIGFPWNLDFSRSCLVQMLPFLGGGGFYYGQLSAATSTLVPEPLNQAFTYDPVVHVGFAARIGVGKQFQKGPLKAGLSISAFCTLEGVWAQRRQLGADHHTALVPPDPYLRVAGTIGLLGEVYGHVDFGIVKAGVSIRVWVAVGWLLETFQPLILSIDAGVEVQVEVVIGRFRIFGKTFQISISFSFSARLHFDWTLGAGDRDAWTRTFGPRPAGRLVGPAAPRDAAALAATPRDLGPAVCLDWAAVPALGATPEPVQLHFAPDVTVVEGGRATVALAVIEAGELAILGRALVAWAAGAWLARVAPGEVVADPLARPFLVDELRHLEACLTLPKSLARGDSGPAGASFQPLDAAALEDFFGKNLRFRLAEPPAMAAGDTRPAAAFPLFSRLALRYSRNGAELATVSLAEPQVSTGYLEELDANFDRLRILLEERSRSASLERALDPGRPLADFLLEDYCHLLLRQTVGTLEGLLAEQANGDDPLRPATRASLSDLIEELAQGKGGGWQSIGSAISRFYLHGLRVPDPGDAETDRGLFDLANLQREIPSGPGTYAITLVEREAAGWLEVVADSRVEIDLGLAPGAVPTVVTALLDGAAEARSPLRERSRRYPLQQPASWSDGGTPRSLWTLPQALRGRLDQHLVWRVFAGDAGKIEDEPATAALPARWATRISLQVERLPGAGGRDVYRLLPLGEAERRLLDRLEKAPEDWLRKLQPRLVFALGGGAVAHRDAAAELWRADLSTEPKPAEGALARSAGQPELLVRAGLADLPDFLALARRASLVRSDGYFLSYRGDGGGLPAAIFDGKGRGELGLVLLHPEGAADPVGELANRVALPADAAGDGGRKVVYARAADESRDRERDLPFAPGTVGFRAYRRHPSRLADVPPGTAAIAEQYHLLEYEVRHGGKILTPPAAVLPVAPREVGRSTPGAEPRPRPAGLADGDWLYEHILPAHKLLHGSDASPYAGVGDDLEVRLRFRDPYGNRLATEAGRVTLPVRYIDRLLSPTDWPAIVPSWRPLAEAGAGRIRLSLRFDPFALYADREKRIWLDPTATDAAGRAAAARVADLRALYRQVSQQLADPHTGLAASFSLGQGGAEFDLDGERPALIELVGNIDAFLADLPRSGQGLPMESAAPDFEWSKVVEPTPQDDDFTELAWRFFLRRPLELVDGAFFAGGPRSAANLLVPQAFEVAAPLAAEVAIGQGDGSGLRLFADAFETAFAGLALAVGVGQGGAHALWAVRRSLVAPAVPKDAQPTFFAVPPLATRLAAGEVEIGGFGDSLPAARLRIADVDLDAHCRTFLRDAESFLQPGLADRVRELDGGALDRVLNAKNALAHAGAGRLATVYADAALSPDEDRIELARRLLRERVATDLRELYDADTLVILPLELPGGSTRELLPVAYGRLVDPLAPAAAAAPVAAPAELRRLSPANVELARGRTALTFVLDSKRETRRSFESMQGVRYRLTHVERRIDGAPEFRDTAWLQLVKPVEVPLPPIEVPVPLRQFPEPPVVEQHLGEGVPLPPAGTFEERVRQARAWTYQADFNHAPVDQDTVYLEVLYNTLPAVARRAALAGLEEPSLLEALVAYHHHRPALWATFAQLLQGAAPAPAKAHLAAFATLTEAVATALAFRPAALRAGLERQKERFRIDDDLDRDDKTRRRLILGRELDAFGGRCEVVPRGAGSAEIGDLRVVEETPGRRVITYPAPPAEIDRYRPRVHRRDLDVLLAENAWGGLFLRRNVELVAGIETNPAFHYETPPVLFGEPFTPWLDHFEPIEIDGGQASLATHLQRLLDTVLGSQDALVELRWGYESGVLARATQGNALIDRPPHPIALLPAFATASVDRAAAVTQMAGLLGAWLAENNPVAGSHLVADLRVYGRQVDKPILRLRRVILPIAKIER